MTARRATIFGLWFLLCAALWAHAARPFLASGWPAFPFSAETLSIDSLLFAFGHLPRGLMALVAGALLGLSGALLQAVLRNPIADPTTLGISSGAQLALVAVLVLAPEWLSWGRWPIAMLGAGVSTALVMAIGSARRFYPVTMVIAGMLIGLFASSVGAAMTLSQGQYLFSLVIWNGGSLVQTGWGPALALTAILACGALASALLARPLSVLALGETGATSLGLNGSRIRLLAIALAAILAASVSAAVGLVAFIGLAAPALARALGARSLKQLLALSPLTGALILSLCDGLVMLAGGASGEMFPTGAITGLIGGPLLLWMLPRLRSTPPPATKERVKRRDRPTPMLAAFAVFLLVSTIILAMVGRVPGGWDVLDGETLRLFLPNRLPRLAGAAAAGGLLALAGAMLQRLTANPLASPELLGVSGGAAIGYAALLFLLPSPSALILTGGAALGGTLAMLIILGVVFQDTVRPQRVLLAGVAISAFASAVLTVLMAAGTMKSFAILAWLSGSASALTATGAALLLAMLTALTIAALILARWLTILPLGPAISKSLGVPLSAAWALIVIMAGLATGAATILVGPLSFVGLVAPHLARHLGLANARAHLMGSVLIGALLMLAADFGARMASFPYDLPLGLFASLLGTPWLIWLLLRRPK
ncbi:Fe(3+)-hydroxamate ABC transporter permease FhuB [Paracoccaceae bacterium GXU_MW_L88]